MTARAKPEGKPAPARPPGPDPSWDDLRVFLFTARTGSFTAAARELGLDQSTVSRRIAALEQALGAELFVRTRDGIRLTPAAEALRVRAARVEEEIAGARQAVSDGGVTGVVRLATTEAFGTLLLQCGLATICADMPGLCLELVTGNRVMDLGRGDADLSLRLQRPREESLSVRKVGEITYAVHGGPLYLARRGAPRSEAELPGHDVVEPCGEMGTTPEARWLQSIPGVRVALRVNSLPALGTALSSGVGLGVLPTTWRAPGLQLERLFPVPAIPPRSVWLVQHPIARDRPAVRAVADIVARLVAQITAPDR